MPGSRKGGAVAAVVAAGVLGAGIVSGMLAGPTVVRSRAVSGGPAAIAPAAVASPGTSLSDRWWKPLPAATSAFVPAQVVIDKLKVQAPVEIKGVDAHNVMEVPDRPTDAAWYRFTAKPGSGSNAVFAGYRDFGQVGNPAIFWKLDQLQPGDLVEVVSDQQTEIRYRVAQTWDYSLTDMPMGQVLAADPADEVTLITCSGTFVRGGYDHRLVVRAVRSAT